MMILNVYVFGARANSWRSCHFKCTGVVLEDLTVYLTFIHVDGQSVLFSFFYQTQQGNNLPFCSRYGNVLHLVGRKGDFSLKFQCSDTGATCVKKDIACTRFSSSRVIDGFISMLVPVTDVRGIYPTIKCIILGRAKNGPLYVAPRGSDLSF